MKQGDLFGEKGLIDNMPRAATVSTKTHCNFIVLEKISFDVIISRLRKMK